MTSIKLQIKHLESITESEIEEDMANFLHRTRMEFIYPCFYDRHNKIISSCSEYPWLQYLVCQDDADDEYLADKEEWQHLLTTIPVKGVLKCKRFVRCRCQYFCAQFDPNVIYCTLYDEVIPDAKDAAHQA